MACQPWSPIFNTWRSECKKDNWFSFFEVTILLDLFLYIMISWGAGNLARREKFDESNLLIEMQPIMHTPSSQSWLLNKDSMQSHIFWYWLLVDCYWPPEEGGLLQDRGAPESNIKTSTKNIQDKSMTGIIHA